MDILITRSSSVSGTLRLPADKAICHRAALLAALSTGAVHIAPWAPGDDCRRTLEALAGLGVGVVRTPDGVRIEGAGLAGWQKPRHALPCGDSGTTMRLLCGALAGQPFCAELAAGPSLSRRPMRRVVEPLTAMGARITGVGSGSDLCPPLAIDGRRPLRGLTHRPSVASAQVKSAILLAGLFADGPTTLEEPLATRDHTERLLEASGALILREGSRITLHPPAQLRLPERLKIPADPSSAAFFIVAAALLPGSRLVISDVSLNPTRIAFLGVLQRMGVLPAIEPHAGGWEPRGTVTIASGAVRGTAVEPTEVPQLIDEIPILMVAACAADSPTRFVGVQELRVKETDRLHSMTEGLQRLGADVRMEPPATIIVRPSRLRGGVVESFGDHRTAMSLAVAGLLAGGDTRIRGAEAVGKSLADFFDLLASVTAPGTLNSIDKA